MQITLTISHDASTTDALADFAQKLVAMFSSVVTPRPEAAIAVKAAPPVEAPVKAPVVIIQPVAAGSNAGVSAPVAFEAIPAPMPAPAAPIPDEEPKRRVRRTKEQIAADEAAAKANAFAPPAEKAPAPVAQTGNFFSLETPAASAPAATEADCRAAFTELVMLDGGEEEVKDVMLRFGFEKFSQVKPEAYGKITSAFRTAAVQLAARNRKAHAA